MFLIDIRCDAGVLATTAPARGWRRLHTADDDIPHLIVVAGQEEAAAIRSGTTPHAAAPILLIADAGVAPPADVDEAIVSPTSEAGACAILDRWRPDPTETLERIESALGVAAVADMLLRLRQQLEAALGDDTLAGTARRAHRLGGIAGMLGFTALGEAWLAVESGVPGACGDARIQTRLALAAIARRLY